VAVAAAWYIFQDNEWVVFNLYMIASTTFLALPHEPLLFFYGKNHGMLTPSLLALVPTMIGCYLDYGMLQPVLTGKYLAGIRERPYYIKISGWFNSLPFLTILVAAATPVPFYPVRLLSISEKYNMHRYMLAVVSGRFPRYLLIASGSGIFEIPDNYILVIFAVIIIWYICLIIYRRTILS
jgi:membrane protein YqaA with SNARE-associated domain